MNFIQHTRAAHDQLTRQPAATPIHVSLYWALFFEWNAHRFPVSLALDHEQLMTAAHIGNRKTYRATLYDLENWGLLTYQPSQSRHQPSRCFLADLPGAELPPVTPPAEGTSAPHKNGFTGTTTAPGNHGLPGPVVPQVKVLSGAEVPQPLLIGNKPSTKSKPPVVVNGAAATAKKKKGPAALPNEGLSEAEVFNPDLPADAPGAAPQKTPRIKRGAPKKKGVHAAAIRAADTAGPNEPRRRGPLPELPFSQSAIATPEAFTAAFEGTDYALADLRHYHQLVATWRDKKTGLPPTRKDWIATAQRFMLNDAADNRLKLAPNVHRPGTDGTGQSNAGIPSTGYRSSRYD
ncbi:hypothetical protein GCM10022408_11620 [Hymenobacter fastidiosus]|uniref:Transcriptional regulator n=1 Tax=Hymenobacter fastidiosus TaxID=486264 RepID=A0ABP7RTP6_9BACT